MAGKRKAITNYLGRPIQRDQTEAKLVISCALLFVSISICVLKIRFPYWSTQNKRKIVFLYIVFALLLKGKGEDGGIRHMYSIRPPLFFFLAVDLSLEVIYSKLDTV